MISPNLNGKVIGGNKAVAKVRSLAGNIRDELRGTVSKLGDDLLTRVKRKLSGEVLHAPTGHLKGSVNKKMEETPASIAAIVGTSTRVVPYARIQEYGGVIVPKNGSYLTFQSGDGRWHRVKKVTIPERSYLRSSLAELRPIAAVQIRAGCRRAAQRSGFK